MNETVTGSSPESRSAASISRPNFDALAWIYRWMEWFSFGPWLGWCRCAWLAEMGTARRALILGDGDGRFTARLLKANRKMRIDTVDISPVMLKALLRRAGKHSDRVSVHCADARIWKPSQACASGDEQEPLYDLVVTHFFLDCLTTGEVSELAVKLRPNLAPGARWAVSEFAVPEGWFGRLIALPLITALYAAFHLLTGLAIRRLPDFDCALTDAGWTLQRRKPLLRGLLVGELWVVEGGTALEPPRTGSIAADPMA